MDVIRCIKLVSATFVSLGMAGAAYGQSCPANGGFEAFKTGIAKEAAAEGVGANVVRRIVPGTPYSASIRRNISPWRCNRSRPPLTR